MTQAETQGYRPTYITGTAADAVAALSPREQVKKLHGFGWMPVLDVSLSRQPYGTTKPQQACLDKLAKQGLKPAKVNDFMQAYQVCDGLELYARALASTGTIDSRADRVGSGEELPCGRRHIRRRHASRNRAAWRAREVPRVDLQLQLQLPHLHRPYLLRPPPLDRMHPMTRPNRKIRTVLAVLGLLSKVGLAPTNEKAIRLPMRKRLDMGPGARMVGNVPDVPTRDETIPTRDGASIRVRIYEPAGAIGAPALRPRRRLRPRGIQVVRPHLPPDCSRGGGCRGLGRVPLGPREPVPRSDQRLRGRARLGAGSAMGQLEAGGRR